MHAQPLANQTTPETAAPRVETMLLGLAFCLPFCSPARLPPNPAFWGEWAAALLFGGWLVSRLWRRPSDAPAPARAVTWVAMGFPAVATLIVAQVAFRAVRSQTESLVVVATLLLAGVVCVAATSGFAAGERRIALRAVAWGLVAAFVANAMAVLMAVNGYGFYGFEITRVGVTMQAVGLIGQANQLGTLAVLALAGAAYLRSQGQLPRWAWVGVVVLAAVMCAMSGSRIAVVEWLLATALAWWLGRGALQQGGAALPMASLRGAVGSVFALVLAQVAWVQGAQLLSTPTVNAARGSFNTRFEILRDGLLMGEAHPLFGVGNGNYAAVRLFELTGAVSRPDADHAHNLLVQAFAEWGPLGLLLVTGAVLLLLRALLRRDTQQPAAAAEHLFAATAVLCLLAHSMVEHPLWFVNLLLPFAWFAGMLRVPSCLTLAETQPLRRSVAALVAAATLGAGALVAADYGRLQSLAMRAAAQGIGAPDRVSRDSLAEISHIAIATLFPTEAAIMQGRAFAFTTDYAELKFDISERALHGVPSAETAARYVAFSALAGRPALGVALLQNMSARSHRVYLETLETLKLFAPAHPLIAEVLHKHTGAAAGS